MLPARAMNKAALRPAIPPLTMTVSSSSESRRPDNSLCSFLHLQMLHDAEFVKKGFLYHLVAVPAYSTMHSSDGKVSKKPVGARFWQIQGPPGAPWTTVNTAIWYVLEMRAKTADPVIKKNVDQTLAELMTLH